MRFRAATGVQIISEWSKATEDTYLIEHNLIIAPACYHTSWPLLI